jgi:cytochrome c biogenesis protein CcdA
MFFSPCSAGLLPAYLTYFSTQKGRDSPADDPSSSVSVPGMTLLGAVGVGVFFAGAVPLFYMAVAGLRILLPGYHVIVPLARFGTGSYIPPVIITTVGTLLIVNSVVVRKGFRGLQVGGVATLGIVLTYLVVGLPVVVLGQWVRPYLTPLELLAGPLIVAIGVMYYTGYELPTPVRFPAREDRSLGRFFSFGVVYGIGSLACNLPVFLGVVLSAFVSEGLATGMAVFGAFVTGMGALMIGVSLVTATTGRSISLGRYTSRVRVVRSVALVLVGGFVTWYTLRAAGYL